MILSCLIAKKKLYSEQTVGCDIFQRELINLLSFHFNYTFTVDLPINFIQHVNKPGKFSSNNFSFVIRIINNNKTFYVFV